ncbi:polymer-forming cytoskeletal protein [candidate division CSSED10-310 bacterium]|uniref:Polymer-forming cytoskeletal protein n=1 Tax=candidate division CSSED10-310 bacterium TaxID=2855610 RepID=A0ABV6Z384_UNCC1
MRFLRKTKSEEQQPSKSNQVVKPPEKIIKQPSSIAVPPPDQKTTFGEDEKQSAGLFNRFQKKTPETERAKKGSKIKTIIGKTVAVNGEISGGEEVLVEGKVEGDIYILSKLSIGISGSVKGKIEAQEIRVAGKSNGEIKATNKIEVAATGDVDGQINTPRLIVLEGAALKGKISTSKSSSIREKERLKNLDIKVAEKVPEKIPEKVPEKVSEKKAEPVPSSNDASKNDVEPVPKMTKDQASEPPLFSKIKEIETKKPLKNKK